MDNNTDSLKYITANDKRHTETYINNENNKNNVKNIIGQKLLVNNKIISLDQAKDLTIFQFEKMINELKSNINKSKYRKVLEDIKEKTVKFKHLSDYWIVYDLKLKCIRKVLEKKFAKYQNSKNIEDWLIRGDLVIEEWSTYLTENSKTKKSKHQQKIKNTHKKFQCTNDNNIQSSYDISIYNVQLELLVKNLLYQCYNYSLFCKYEKRLADTLGFLALGERLIKFVIDYSSMPDSLNIMQKILLYISAILIADNDFVIAIKYQTNSLKISLRELYQRVDYTEGIIIEKMTKNELYNFQKCIINIVIAFYHKGICEEHLGCLLKAIESYKQSKWFCNNFLKDCNLELTQYINDVESRALSYYIIIKKIKDHAKLNKQNKKINCSNKYSENNNNINVNDYQIKSKFIKSNVFYNEEENLKKFNYLVSKIENINFPEIEDNKVLEKKSKNIEYIMSTIKIINHLSSSKFRDFLIKGVKLKDLQLGNMSCELKDAIQRKLNEVKACEHYEENKKLKKMKENNINCSIFKYRDIMLKNKLCRSDNKNYTVTELNYNINNNFEIINNKKSKLYCKNNASNKTNCSFSCDNVVILKNIKANTINKESKLKNKNKVLSSIINSITKNKHNKMSIDYIENYNSNSLSKYQTRPQTSIMHNIKNLSITNQSYSKYNQVNSTNIKHNNLTFNSKSNNLDSYSDNELQNSKFDNINNNITNIKKQYCNDKVKKYCFSDYISKKSYQNKLKYINKLDLKEMKFHKENLINKKNEKIVIDKLDLKKINKNCEQFFQKVLLNSRKPFLEEDKAKRKKKFMQVTKKIIKENKNNNDLTRKLLNTFNLKNIENLKTFEDKKQNSSKNKLSKIHNLNKKSSNLNKKLYLEFHNYNTVYSKNQINKDMLEKEKLLLNQIDELKKFEISCKKIINPNKLLFKKVKIKQYYNPSQELFKSKVYDFIRDVSSNGEEDNR